MGKLSTEPEQTPQITHFFHSHPLEITTIIPENIRIPCSGCSIHILPGKSYYSCKTCGFCLHGTCFNLPRKISHPTDPNHHLILVQSPAFHCTGCGNPGSGFSYSCKACSRNYHSLCTLKPLSIFHNSHPHPLVLEFGPAYEGKGFLCDICRSPGGFGQWFYSCSGCGFDIHLDCTKSSTTDYPTTGQRSLVMNNNSVTPTGVSQFNPGGSFVNQGMNNNVVPNVSPAGSYVGNSQIMLLRPSGVPTMTVLQPNGMNTLSYATPVSGVPGQRGGPMNGMGGVFVNGVAAGIGQQIGQELVHGLTGGLGGGSGNSDNGGLSDIMSSWIGGSDYY